MDFRCHDQADLAHTVHLQAHRDTPGRHSEEVIHRAVQGVDDPCESGRSRPARPFLAHDRVVGALGQETGDDAGFGTPIHIGHSVRGGRLDVDVQLGRPIVAQECSGVFRDLPCQPGLRMQIEDLREVHDTILPTGTIARYRAS